MKLLDHHGKGDAWKKTPVSYSGHAADCATVPEKIVVLFYFWDCHSNMNTGTKCIVALLSLNDGSS